MPSTSTPGQQSLDRGTTKPNGSPAPTFKPVLGAAGPTDENWLLHLINIRGAVSALRFDDRELTERMRGGFVSVEAARDPIRAWADTEHELAAAIEILRTAQTRCNLAVSRRDPPPFALEAATGALPKP